MNNIVTFLFLIQECFITATINAFYLHNSDDYFTSKVVKLKESNHSEIFISDFEYKILIANSDINNMPKFKSNGEQIKFINTKKDTIINFEIDNNICTSMVILFKRK